MIHDFIHSVDCHALRSSISPFVTTIFVGIIGLLLYTIYEEYVFQKEMSKEEDEKRQNRKADVYDVEEIPHKYLYFQKLITVLNESTLPEWCLRDQKTFQGVIDDLLVWMRDEKHPNFADCCDVFTIIDSKEIERPRVVEEAHKWMHVACRLWMVFPMEEMPSWMIEPLVYSESSAQTTPVQSRKNSSMTEQLSRKNSNVESIPLQEAPSSDVNS